MSSARIQKNLTYKTVKNIIFSDKTETYHFNYYKKLYECACQQGEFDRTKSKRRAELEKKIDQLICDSFPKKQLPLNYLSFGAGGLLQDYIYCENLILKKYSLNIFFIEPDNQTQHFIDALKQFENLKELAKKNKVELTIATYDSIVSFMKLNPTTQIDIAVAIDFPLPKTHFVDIAFVHQTLKFNGIFYLALLEHDILLKKTVCEYKKNIHWWKKLFSEDPILTDICQLPTDNTLNRAEVILKSVTKIGKTVEANEKHILKIIMQYVGMFRTLPPEIENTSPSIRYEFP